jgi:hypothetical protein
MYNQGYTFTNAGHAAITTGIYQNISNSGSELPQKPSFFQYWLQQTGLPNSQAWIITTKDKLEVLSNCYDPAFNNKFRPYTDCGNAGLGTGYRQDSTTLQKTLAVMGSYHPQVLLVNFKEPDAAGHSADSLAYMQGILDTDLYIEQIWQAIQNDPFYKDQTTLLVTNDHGRHTAGHLDGYVSHNDDCDGCRHIELFALGPNIKKNHSSMVEYSQIDIAATVAKLLHIEMPESDGKPVYDIFEANKIP